MFYFRIKMSENNNVGLIENPDEEEQQYRDTVKQLKKITKDMKTAYYELREVKNGLQNDRLKKGL